MARIIGFFTLVFFLMVGIIGCGLPAPLTVVAFRPFDPPGADNTPTKPEKLTSYKLTPEQLERLKKNRPDLFTPEHQEKVRKFFLKAGYDPVTLERLDTKKTKNE